MVDYDGDLMRVATVDGSTMPCRCLHQDGNVQVWLCSQAENTTIKAHAHASSVEFFIVLSGTITICGQSVGANEVYTVSAGIPHGPISSAGGAVYLAIIHPPEHAYDKPKESDNDND